MTNFHVSFNEESRGKYTEEELYAFINRVNEALAERYALPIHEQMRLDMEMMYEDLAKAINLCKWHIDEHLTEDIIRRGEIFCGIESAMMLLGNWSRPEAAGRSGC